MTMDGIAHDVGKWDLLIAHPPYTHNGQEGRAKARSKTAPGIAKAMSEQWG